MDKSNKPLPGCVVMMCLYFLMALALSERCGRDSALDEEAALDTLTVESVPPHSLQSPSRPIPRVRLPRLQPCTHSGSGGADSPYAEGYDDGYEQGMEDGANGQDHDYGYDESTRYRGDDRVRYEQGYDDGYNDGYAEGKSACNDD